jgi:IPT/TIG domain
MVRFARRRRGLIWSVAVKVVVTVLPLVVISSVFLPAYVLSTTTGRKSAGAPRILFTDVEGGPVSGGPSNKGIPISIFGSGFGGSRGTSKITIGGVEVAGYLAWGSRNASNPALDMIVVQPGAAVRGGPIVVSVNGLRSNAVPFSRRAGTIFSVAVGGSDANPCTEVAPCATTQHVVADVMKPVTQRCFVAEHTPNQKCGFVGRTDSRARPPRASS